jgi:hypothetical protein
VSRLIRRLNTKAIVHRVLNLLLAPEVANANSPIAKPTNVKPDGSGTGGGPCTKPPVESMARLQPLLIIEAVSPAVSSKAYRLHVPSGSDPVNKLVKVVVPCGVAQSMLDGAGAGKPGQVVPNTVGLNDPEVIIPLVRLVTAVSVRVRVISVNE